MKWKERTAWFIVRRRIPILLAILILAAWSGAMISHTVINFDLNRYLSDDTMTKRALQVMDEEFGSSDQLRLMFADLSQETMGKILGQLNDLPQVRLAGHNPETDCALQEGKTWQLVTLTLRECDEAALVTQLRGMFSGEETCYVGGPAATQLDLQKSIAKEMPEVLGIAVAIIFLVLLLTSHAWLEPLLILTVLGISIMINMGTNFIFPDVSFITFAVCAILQLALSIDYAVMLLHAFHGCADQGLPPEEAMAEALVQCFMRIASSAMTTVAGLLSLLFMSFTIGFDIGLVLSKGIVISMFCVFCLMPSLVLLLEKPLRATRHRPVRLGGEYLAEGIYRYRRIAAPVLVAAVLAGAFLTSQNTYTFTDPGAAARSETARVNAVFGVSSPLVLLFPSEESDEDYDRQRELAEKLLALTRETGENVVKSVTAMVTTGAQALQYYTAADVAQMTGLPELAVRMFFAAKGFDSSVRGDILLEEASTLPGENASLDEMRELLATARESLQGTNYARMLLDMNVLPSDKDFTQIMDQILASAREIYGDDFYVTGVPMSSYDIGHAFQGDLLKVNVITLLAILLIVVISFRAVKLPLILVFVIEGAIWITMGVSRLIGEPIFFISYLICLSIQMGATIDYGILLCDQYRIHRDSGLGAREALKASLGKSLPTILTSGTILVTAGYLIGIRCSVFYISSIGLLVSRGAFVSALLVLTLLPALLTLTDAAAGSVDSD